MTMNRTKHHILEDTEYETHVYVAQAAQTGPTAVVVAGVHGNEETTPLAADLIKLWSISRGTLVVIPRANKPAVQDGTRAGPNGDLNRQFPAGERPTTEVARGIWDEITSHSPNYVFDLHRSKGLYQRNPSGVGQAIFPTPNARKVAHDALSHLNGDHVDRSSHEFIIGNDQDGRNDLLSHKVGADLLAQGWLVETTYHEQSSEVQIQQLEHAVQTLLWYATGGAMQVVDYGHVDQEPDPDVLDEYDENQGWTPAERAKEEARALIDEIEERFNL